MPYHTVPKLPTYYFKTILKNSNLSFKDVFFLQPKIYKNTPTYTNFPMGHHEETICEIFIWAIFSWKRFINNIFYFF